MTENDKIVKILEAEGAIVDDRLYGPGEPNGLYLAQEGRKPLVLVNRQLRGREKLCVLAEEAGHHFTAYGSALDEYDPTERVNELRGRRWAYRRLVPLRKVIAAWDDDCREQWEMARFCGVTEPFLIDSITYYHGKYGERCRVGERIVQFDPFFRVWGASC